MTTKHFINDGTTLVQDSLHGLALSNPFLRYDEDIKGKNKTKNTSCALFSCHIHIHEVC